MTFTSRPDPVVKWLETKIKSPRVLFLDDDINICSVMQVWCQKLNIELVCCHTIKDAMLMFDNIGGTLNAMILDVKLSNGSGMDFYARVMRERPELHVMFLTAFDSPQVRDAVERIGPARVHSKTNTITEQFLTALFVQWGLVPPTAMTTMTQAPFPRRRLTDA